MKLKRKPRANVSRQLQSRIRPWMWLGVLALAIVGLLAFAVQGQMRGTGIVSAESTLQDLGEVPIYGGLAEARFPLTVQGETRITGITTSWMCTLARLVQANQVSDWFGMQHTASIQSNVNFRLLPDEPIFLEVTVDPAAHGEAGLGPIRRSVLLKTQNEQILQLDVVAEVVP